MKKNKMLYTYCTLFITLSAMWGCEDNYDLPNIVKEYNHVKPIKQEAPKGMQIVWADEFNGTELDRTKWSTNYYSQSDFMGKANYDDFLNDNLPQPGLMFTDSSVVIYTDVLVPDRPYWSGGRKVSSIQTYDWNHDENKLGNLVGGYIEARLRRSASNDATEINTAFWFDSPGPDLKYYIEKGNTALGATGIRPRGQVYEIDLCEYLDTEIILHSNISPNGTWQGLLGQYRVSNVEFEDQWVTHSMLWTPSSLKFYVNGIYQTEWSDPNDIKSPNHFMNIFLGSYGKLGKVSMEVDYIRFYQWELEEGNELPNSNFEYSENLQPWTGTGSISTTNVHNGKQSLQLQPKQFVEQYVYIDHSTDYSLSYFSDGDMDVKIENIIPVSGIAFEDFGIQSSSSGYKQNEILFTSKVEDGINKATIKITLLNKGISDAYVDKMVLKKK